MFHCSYEFMISFIAYVEILIVNTNTNKKIEVNFFILNYV